MIPATVCLVSDLLAPGMFGPGEPALRHEDEMTCKPLGASSVPVGAAGLVVIRLSMKTLNNGPTEAGAFVAPVGMATLRFVIGKVTEPL